MPTATLHVRTRDDGTWIVEQEGAERPVSEHREATGAASAAAAHAEALGGADVIVHDRYHHVHVIHRAPARPVRQPAPGRSGRSGRA